MTADSEVGADLTFKLVDDPDLAELGRGSFIVPLSSDGGVLVATSLCPEMQPEPGCRRSILRSVGGLDWDVVGKPIPFPGSFTGIARTSAGFLFVVENWKKDRPVVYQSLDGIEWQQSPLRGTDYFEEVVGGPGRYLGFGCDRYCERTIPFWSADGRRWERDAGFTEKVRLTAAATSGDVLIAIGEQRNDEQVAMAFADGSWRRLDLPLPPAPDGGWLRLADVAAVPDGGFAILGELERPNSTAGPFLLTSSDGVAWESVLIELDLGIDRLRFQPYQIAVGPDLLAVAVWPEGRGARELGLNGAEAIAWSRDGDEWHLATLPGRPRAKEASIRDLVVTDEGRVVVVGETRNDRTSRAAIWVGALEQASAEGENTVTPSPTPTLTPTRAQQEADLLAQAGFESCSPFRARGEFDPFEFGAAAAVQCDRPANGIRQVAAFVFPDAASLDDYWSYRVGSLDDPLERSGQACREGKPGWSRWDHGRVMCYVSGSGGQAKVRWTDERTNTYWIADANDRGLARLVRWWRRERP